MINIFIFREREIADESLIYKPLNSQQQTLYYMYIDFKQNISALRKLLATRKINKAE